MFCRQARQININAFSLGKTLPAQTGQIFEQIENCGAEILVHLRTICSSRTCHEPIRIHRVSPPSSGGLTRFLLTSLMVWTAAPQRPVWMLNISPFSWSGHPPPFAVDYPFPNFCFSAFASRPIILPVQPKQLETLDDLLAQAEHYANHSMRNIGRLPPTVFLIGPDGPLMFMPESLADEKAKDDFATNARLMCIAHGATVCVMALEAWAKFATPGEKLDETEPPSEALDRREFVILMGESHGGQKQKFLPIIRSDNGKFFGFGESEAPAMDEMKGRFAQLLPTKIPDAALRDVAKAMLKAKGVSRAMSGATPRLPRSRR